VHTQEPRFCAAYDDELEAVEVDEIDPIPEGERTARIACGAEILDAASLVTKWKCQRTSE